MNKKGSKELPSVLDIPDLKGKRVLVRVDWNVPMHNGKVLGDFRIKKTMPTLEYLENAGAQVLIATHLTNGSIDALDPFVPEGMRLLANLRDDPGEVENSVKFARSLAKQADIYVNEAFSASHRKHASIVGVPQLLPSYAGIQFKLEVKELSRLFKPKHPFLFILGGAKFETKIPLIKKFTKIADHIFIGGAVANTFFRAQGRDIGKSLTSEHDFDAKELLELFNTKKIILPEDTVVDGGKILDIGPRSAESLKQKILEAEVVLWNGPMGNYELGYKVGTLKVGKLIADFAKESIVGGGDTLTALRELNLHHEFSFVSTGGGALLDFLAKGTLPGIEALK